MNGRKCILVAEDDENDVFLLRHAFERIGLCDKLVHVSDGEKALEYLAGKPPFSDRGQHPFPDLLLLDLKMPRLDGFGVLRRLQSHPELNALPVVVLSSSSMQADIEEARSLGARDFLTKPTDPAGLRRLVLGLHERWCEAGLPTAPKAVDCMRIVLHNFGTERYLKSATEWTPNQREAMEFESRAEAIRVARELRLQNIEILHLNPDGTRFLGTALGAGPEDVNKLPDANPSAQL